MKISSIDAIHTDDLTVAARVAELTPYTATLRASLHDHAYTHHESALAAATDHNRITEAHALAARFRSALRTVILVGIGGSDLGTRAVYDALAGHTERGRGATPRLVCFDTVEPDRLRELRELFGDHTHPDELVLVVISKSGSTAETLVNANVLHRAFAERFGSDAADSHTIVITDDATGLGDRAEARRMVHSIIPRAVGGRFSVFTPVGLVPLALLGIDIDAFVRGGAAGADAAAPAPDRTSSAAVVAALLFEAYRSGLHIHDTFLWHPALETLGKWYRQLLAESVGKQDSNGNRVGITPTVAVGSNDLHSMTQLVFGGPATRFTTFVAAPSLWGDGEPCDPASPFIHDDILGTDPGSLMRAIHHGVRIAYRQHHLPFIEIELANIDARELGAYMALCMASVMHLAQLLKVNPFTQPDVEHYKKETRHALATFRTTHP